MAVGAVVVGRRVVAEGTAATRVEAEVHPAEETEEPMAMEATAVVVM